MYNFKSKTAVITGASKGIGKSLVIFFASYGCNVILLSRDTTKMKTIIKDLNPISNQYFQFYKLDISNENMVNDVFNKILNNNKSVDILINNAGITSDNILLKMKSEQWNSVINTNLSGTYYCCKAVLKQMIKQKSGKIINISSIIGQIGNKGQANYAASKSGINGLTKSIAKEVASRNINVNSVNPGFIQTDMTETIGKDNKDNFINNIPLNRFGNSDDVANLVCFLASNKSDYITGQCINVDGGIVM